MLMFHFFRLTYRHTYADKQNKTLTYLIHCFISVPLTHYCSVDLAALIIWISPFAVVGIPSRCFIVSYSAKKFL